MSQTPDRDRNAREQALRAMKRALLRSDLCGGAALALSAAILELERAPAG